PLRWFARSCRALCGRFYVASAQLPPPHPPGDLRDVDSRLVHVEAPDDVHEGGGGGVPLRGRDDLLNRLDKGIDVYPLLGRDGYYRGVSRHGLRDKVLNRLVILHRLLVRHEVYLVLDDDDLLHPEHLKGLEVLSRLRPRDRLVCGDDEKGAVHQEGSREHVRHQTLVAWRIDEADRPQQ